jgi:Flp pilus assembly pilin Flp
VLGAGEHAAIVAAKVDKQAVEHGLACLFVCKALGAALGTLGGGVAGDWGRHALFERLRDVLV